MRRVLFPFALTMQEEAKVDSKIAINFDANHLVDDKYLSNETKRKSRYGRSIQTYTQNWLNAQVTLVDNTDLQINCEKNVYEIKIVKRSASGKTKYKSKTKSRDSIVIKAVMSKQQYALSGIEPLPNLLIDEDSDSIAIQAKYKFKTAGLKTMQAQTIFELVHQMYSHVKPI